MSSLEIKNLVAGYGSVTVLHGVSMDVPEGAIVALLGTNGNGKSTLIKSILGIVRARSGAIVLGRAGKQYPLHEMSPQQIVELGVAIVPEGRRLFSGMTVRENLLLGCYHKSERGLAERGLDYVFATFPILAERSKQDVGTMSGGQQQMVAIGRALMSEPKLLLIDEPSVGLAPNIVKQTIEQVKELRDNRGLTVLMAEQSFHQAVAVADKAYVLAHGEIAMQGDDMERFGSDDAVRSVYLGV